MKKIFLFFSFVALITFVTFSLMQSDENSAAIQSTKAYTDPDTAKTTTADHSRFPELQQEFSSAEEVVDQCLKCHTEAAKQVHNTIHWTWVCPKAKVKDNTLGKVTVINNFCMGLQSNEPRCTSCHAGFGWKDSTFDFTSERNVDCFVCHDQTGSYKKFPTGAGYPVKDTTFFPSSQKWFYPPDWNKIAQNVGKPKRNNCGTCHYFGGGGNKVKHGDLDVIMNDCDESIDVHMASNGLNFDCTTCHTTKAHKISGRCYTSPATEDNDFHLMTIDENRILCESCHSEEPHDLAKLNHHTDKVACQSCHIPIMAKGNPTKMWWDWSKAGKKGDDGKPLVIMNEQGEITYDSKKGEFEWAQRIEPEYYWYNGAIEATLLESKIDDSKLPVQMNRLTGHYNDPDSKIMPFKVHRGIQPYDPVNKTFVVPKLFGKKEEGAYWKTFDWQVAIKAGMDYAGAPYSGKYEFIETEMYWVISHMVAPKEESLQCEDCHSRNDSRLKNLTGFYMPARDHNIVDTLGIILIGLALAGVFTHGMLRAFGKKSNQDKENEVNEGGEV
ncbi:MAG: tetrathionate reductase family octaheme c-type cytochrome [Candidatus Kapaibacterium sp.]